MILISSPNDIDQVVAIVMIDSILLFMVFFFYG